MPENVVPFRTQEGRGLPRSKDQQRLDEEKKRQDEADRRRERADDILMNLDASARKGKRGRTIRDETDRFQIARNLDRILDEAEHGGVRRKLVLEDAKLGNPGDDSTKYLHQYTIPDGLDGERLQKRSARLSGILDNYVTIAGSAGSTLGHDSHWFIADLFRDTSFDRDADIEDAERAWLREIRDLLAAMANAALRHGLDAYLDNLRCGHLGWHPTLGFGEFDSLHPARVYRGGDIRQFCRNDTWNELVSWCSQHVSVTVYREVGLGIAPFGEEPSWAACFEKRLRYHFQARDVSFDTYDPFGGCWQLEYQPAIRHGPTWDDQDLSIEFPEGWFEQLPFDGDFIEADGGRLDSAFRYERVDLASCRKYLGSPQDPGEIELGDWWADALEEVRENSSFSETEWDHPWGLTKYLCCPPGTLARAVEQNLLYEQEPARRLDNRLFDAVATTTEDAATAKRGIETERASRIEALKRRWDGR